MKKNYKISSLFPLSCLSLTTTKKNIPIKIKLKTNVDISAHQYT